MKGEGLVREGWGRVKRKGKRCLVTLFRDRKGQTLSGSGRGRNEKRSTSGNGKLRKMFYF